VPETVQRVVDELTGLGVRVVKRERPAPPDLWWQSACRPPGEIM